MTRQHIFTKSLLFFAACLFTTLLRAADTVAIMGAMDVEIEKLLPEIKNRKETQLRGHTYYTGTLCEQNVVVTRSGIGKVNAALTTSELINHFSADSIIFTGIAGAAHPELEPKDVVISTALVQHDVDLTTFGYEAGHMQGFDDRLFEADQQLIQLATTAAEGFVGQENVNQGVIATGDQFIADKADVKNIHHEFQAMAVEMEGAAMAQVAFLYDKPMVVIRTISDKADGSAHMDYNTMKAITAYNSTGITLRILEAMPSSI